MVENNDFAQLNEYIFLMQRPETAPFIKIWKIMRFHVIIIIIG